MKKLNVILALLLVLAMLAGCSGESKKPGGTVEANPTVAVTEAPVETEPAQDETVSMGRLVGGVYTNSYAGYACQLDSDWMFYSAEELQSIPANVAEMLGDSEFLDDETVLSQFTDMMAENANDLASINVLYQKLGVQERLAYAIMSEREVLEATLQQQDVLMDAYANAGITVESMEIVTVNFLGEQRAAMHSSMSIEGVPYYTLQIFDFNKGAYGVTLTLATYLDDRTEDLATLFYAVD